jgi:hypothetical protein
VVPGAGSANHVSASLVAVARLAERARMVEVEWGIARNGTTDAIYFGDLR